MNRSRIIVETVGYMGLRGLLYGIALGAAYGTFLAPIAGTIYGAFFGGMVGLPLGIIGGTIIGTVTGLWFDPSENPSRFRWTITLTGGVIGFLGAYVGFDTLLGPGGSANEQSAFMLLPVFIAAACASYVSNSYARRYLAKAEEASNPETYRYKGIPG